MLTISNRTPGRAGLAVAAVTGLTASFLTGMVVAGAFDTPAVPPVGRTGAPPAEPPLQLVNADLTVPGSCSALLDSYVQRGVERVTPYGWDFPYFTAMEGDMVESEGAARAEGSGAAPAAGVVEQQNSATGTNVQEAGVDEPDVVKTDGEVLLRIRDDDLLVYDVAGTDPTELSDTDLPSALGTGSTELLLAGDTVVVLGTDPTVGIGYGVEQHTVTHMVSYDITDPSSPVQVDHRSWDAGLVQAVQHDDDVRLVLRSGLPDLDFVQPRWWRGEDGALERNRAVVERSTIEDWLPTVTTHDVDGDEAGTTQLLDCSRVTVPGDADDSGGLGTIAVVGFDADDPADTDTLGVATDTRLAYFSAGRMYLATGGWPWGGCCWGGPLADRAFDAGRTQLYAFALDGTDTTYVASGEVDGMIADRWAMDEHDGVLRVAVGPSPGTGNFNSVVTLREDGDELREIGRVDKLGVGEEIKSVRWFDGLAIVVTFRQVDPLYPIDLTDPDDPELLGELKIPGFSEYLHPISGQRLIGIGQDATRDGRGLGAQAALFNVADLADPRRTDVVGYGDNSVASAATDPRQFTWLPGRQTALTVVWEGWEGRTGQVSVLTVSGDRLANRMVEVEHGTDVDLVRLVPLPDDRVVLVTGDDVSFFDL